jgi:cytochrome c oxidase cbb3-type subunit 1
MQSAVRANDDSGATLGIALILGCSALFAIFAAAATAEAAFRLHMYLFLALMLVGIAALTHIATGEKPQADSGGYNYGVVKAGVIASTFWGVVGMLVGVVIALQLAYPETFTFPEFGFLNFGRLRPLHTSAVIFAFGGNVLIATSFYVVQRTCKATLPGGLWPWFVFWGYQVFIVMAATGYLMGITQSKEYAEPEWYVDIWLTIVWVAYLLVFLGTLWRRKEPHIYVANWFYLAFIVTIAILHIVNNLGLPVSIGHYESYPLFPGVRWCSGGTATTPSASSSPPAFWRSCTTSSRSKPIARSIPIACRSSTSGR